MHNLGKYVHFETGNVFKCKYGKYPAFYKFDNECIISMVTWIWMLVSKLLYFSLFRNAVLLHHLKCCIIIMWPYKLYSFALVIYFFELHVYEFWTAQLLQLLYHFQKPPMTSSLYRATLQMVLYLLMLWNID